MEDDDDAQESTEHPRSSGAKEPTGEQKEDGDCAPEMTSNSTSVTATHSNQQTEENTGTLVDEIDFNDNDAVFEKLWELVAVPVTWSSGFSLHYRDGPPSWEEVQKIWDAIDDKGKKKELAERKRRDDNCEILDEDESNEHVLLHAACARQPPVQIVQDLIEASESTIFEKGEYDMMPLHFACRGKASVEVVRALLKADESKATLMAKDAYGYTAVWTPLHFACRYKASVEVVRALLEADESKATLVAKDEDGWTPLHFACRYKASVEVVRALLKADKSKATVVAKHKYGYTPLHFACRYEASVEVVRALLEADESKETLVAKNLWGCTPLHSACAHNASVEVALALLKADESMATLMVKDDNGWTPLHNACRNKASVEVVQALLEADQSTATLMVKDDNGWTPLHLACKYKASVEVVQALLEADKSKESLVATSDYLKKTPIDYFAENHATPDPRESKEQWEQTVTLLARYTHYSKGSYFESLKKVFEADRERLFDNHFIWQLNQAMRNPFYTFVLMLDLLSNILLAVMFTVVSSSYASSLASSSSAPVGYFVGIYMMLCVLTVREAIQAWSEGFFVDIWNLFDMSTIILVLVSTLFMHTGKSYTDASYSLVMAAGFLTWIHALSSLRSSFLEFAVFISGITNVLIKLVPFIVTTLLILCGFAYIYHMNNARAGLNSSSSRTSGFGTGLNSSSSFASSFGTYGDALFTTSAMMLNGIDEDMLASDQEDLTVKWLSFLFALLMVVLLLNVIIAIVSTSWEEVTAKGRNVFLGNRIAFLSELKFKAFDCTINRMKYEHDVDKVENILRHAYQVRIQLRDYADTTFDSYLRSSFRDDGIVIFLWKNPVSWEALKRPFLIAFLQCQAINGEIYNVELEALGMFLATYVFSPLQFLCGLVTFGYFWPPAFRQFLFQIKEVDDDAPTLQKLNAELKDELLNEIKKELAQSVREIVSSIDRARDTQLNTELKDEIVGEMKKELSLSIGEIVSSIDRARET